MNRVPGDLLGVLKLFVYGSGSDDTNVRKTLLLLLLILSIMNKQGDNSAPTLFLERNDVKGQNYSGKVRAPRFWGRRIKFRQDLENSVTIGQWNSN